jgi:sugar O-acyltransferase (sialic acid O-acetyltransferase NeuD family)
MKCAIIGYGELGRQLHAFIQAMDAPEVTVFFDDGCYDRKEPNAFPFNDYLQEQFADYAFFIGLGYKQLAAKEKILQQLLSAGRNLPSLVHHTAWIAPTAHIGQAVYVYPLCNIDKNVVLAPGALLNNSVTISHDSVVGQCSYLSPGVVVCGFTQIGSGSFIGAGTTLANHVSLGSNVVVGIGSVVTQNIPDGTHCIGNPLKLLNKPIKLN